MPFSPEPGPGGLRQWPPGQRCAGTTVLPRFLPTPTPTHPVLSCPELGAVKSLGAAQYRIPQGGRGQSWPLEPPAPRGPLEGLHRCISFPTHHRTSRLLRLAAPCALTHAPAQPSGLVGKTPCTPGPVNFAPFLESGGATGFKKHQGEWKPAVGGDFQRVPCSRDSTVLSLSLLDLLLGTWVGIAQPRQTQVPSLMPCPHLPDPTAWFQDNITVEITKHVHSSMHFSTPYFCAS